MDATVVSALGSSIGIAKELRSVCDKYLSGFRQYPEAIEDINQQLAVCTPQLVCVQKILGDGPDSDLRDMLLETGVLRKIHVCLQKLRDLVGSLRTHSVMARAAWPLKGQQEAERLLKSLEEHRSNIRSALAINQSLAINQVKQTNATISIQLTEERKRGILRWLKPREPESMHEVHVEMRDLQEDETCDWMTDSTLWKQWLNGDNYEEESCRRFLWIWGIPGSGKTILDSFLIDQVRQHCSEKGVAYYYCLFGHAKTRNETRFFLRSIVSELCRQMNCFIPQLLATLDESQEPTTDCLLACLEEICHKRLGTEQARVYIVIDGVDECRSPRTEILKVLVAIGTEDRFANVSLLMFSREETDIKTAVDEVNNLHAHSNQRPLHVGTGTPNRTSKRAASQIFHGTNHKRRQINNRGNSDYSFQFGVDHASIDQLDYITSPASQAQDPNTHQRAHRLCTIATHGSVCTILSMSNPLLERSIKLYIQRQLRKIEGVSRHLSSKQVEDAELALARGSKGMFRWAACQVQLIKSWQFVTPERIENLLNNLPKTVFETYERVIADIASGDFDSDDRKFARTALALICNDSSEIPDANVLTEASCFQVSHGVHHDYDVNRLTSTLGCLIKVTNLRKVPFSHWTRPEKSNVGFSRVSPAHYTVKEYLFSRDTLKAEKAKDFALTKNKIQVLELQVGFNGLQKFEIVRGQRHPTRYHEYCLRITDRALQTRRALIMSEEIIWRAVLQCLRATSPHHQALTSRRFREAFPRWAKLSSFEEESAPRQSNTSILVNLILLRWPELMKKFLGTLTLAEKEAIWIDRFALRPADLRQPGQGEKKPETVLQLCVLGRHVALLEILIDSGASFSHEPSIVLLALKDPYHDGDGSTTSRLLTMLLERGANPQPRGYKFTPLQFAVRNLEERWVYLLLSEYPDPNTVGERAGDHPWEIDGPHEDWHGQHPLAICRAAEPDWQEADAESLQELIDKARAQIKSLLEFHDATEVIQIDSGGEAGESDDDQASHVNSP